MCRHLAYLGPSIRLGSILVDPEHSLVSQAWAPRRQTHGVVNADGFGVGWYVDGIAEPARHRGDRPIWTDETLTDLARVVRTRAVLAAVRSAMVGSDPGVRAAAPFRWGRWLFSHNGSLEGWSDAAGDLLAAVPPHLLSTLETTTDSAWLWMLIRGRLERGDEVTQVVADVVRQVRADRAGALNLLLTDGQRIVATRWGASLVWGFSGDGVIVASEPHDGATAWQEVPDRHLLHARDGEVALTAL
jgi:glutamine amidotransferase